MSVKQSSNKKKKVNVSLSMRETDLLQLYASQNGITKSVAAKRLLKEGLHQYATMLEKNNMPCNQLGLFDGVQTDIFCVEEMK